MSAVSNKTENKAMHANTRSNSTMLSLQNVSLAYDEKTVLEQVSFTLQKGAVGCILGPSGSGKTSLLRAIAGFIPLQAGEICIDQLVVSNKALTKAPKQRSIGLVFQDFALFPHMSVAQNIAFGLHNLSPNIQKQRVDEYMKITGIEALKDMYPGELSGGQQQRVAIARAIAPQPELLLMDEAFSSLDPNLREQIAQDVRRIVKSLGLTALLVTHDQTEAFAFADQIAVVANKSLQQFASAYDLYHQPETYFVANFIGEGAFINGVVHESANGMMAHTALGQFMLEDSQVNRFKLSHQQSVRILLRPDDLIHDDASTNKAIIEETHFRGAYIRFTLRIESSQEKVLCFAPSHHNHKIGEQFGIRVKVDHVICFP